ncbi:MAG: PAS domain S-box protein [Deltaproteobacteria bacterium]|nr:PAS domain S-box protein [Deltaproteobacteria bacterium]
MNEVQGQKPMRWGARLREENRRLREKIDTLKKERHRLEKVIQNRSKLFHELPEPALLVQKDKIIMANEAISRLLGFTSDELEAMGIYEIIHPGSRAHLAAVHRALVVGDPAQGLHDVSLNDRSGGEIICDIHLRKFRYEQGRTTLLMHIHDLTERQKWEQDRCETLKREAIERMGTHFMKTLKDCPHHLKTGIDEMPSPGPL